MRAWSQAPEAVQLAVQGQAEFQTQIYGFLSIVALPEDKLKVTRLV